VSGAEFRAVSSALPELPAQVAAAAEDIAAAGAWASAPWVVRRVYSQPNAPLGHGQVKKFLGQFFEQMLPPSRIDGR
jgi:hypothetical protein